MKLRYYKGSTVISVSCNESKTSETTRTEVFYPNFPIAKGDWEIIPRAKLSGAVIMRLMLQKQCMEDCMLETTPQSGGFNAGSLHCGFYTRDFSSHFICAYLFPAR
jgi:hypothetical protein